MREVEEITVARTPSFLGVGVETRVQSRPSQLSVAFGASGRLSMSLNGDPRRAGSREEQEGEEAAVGLVPSGNVGQSSSQRVWPGRSA